jgi:hypothetical protein
MDKSKKIRHINDPAVANDAGYPQYPVAEDIYVQSTNEGELSPDSNTEIAEPTSVIKDWHDKEFDPDALKSELDTPGPELDKKGKKIGGEDEENNYYSIGGDDHNDLEEDNEG